MRTDLRRADQLDYALNDFDWSLLLPADVSIKTFRLPITETYPGVYEKPYEALRGDVDFNPFAYDVGCLGIQFAYTLQVFLSSVCSYHTLIGNQCSTFVHPFHSLLRS
jgi:hypothetical protein